MEWLIHWLSPEGAIAAGVLTGLIQQAIGSYRTAKAVRVLADNTAASHALALGAAGKIDAVAATLDVVVEQTNGMSHRLEQLAGEAGVARGKAEAERNRP